MSSKQAWIASWHFFEPFKSSEINFSDSASSCETVDAHSLLLLISPSMSLFNSSDFPWWKKDVYIWISDIVVFDLFFAAIERLNSWLKGETRSVAAVIWSSKTLNWEFTESVRAVRERMLREWSSSYLETSFSRACCLSTASAVSLWSSLSVDSNVRMNGLGSRCLREETSRCGTAWSLLSSSMNS